MANKVQIKHRVLIALMIRYSSSTPPVFPAQLDLPFATFLAKTKMMSGVDKS